MSLLPKLTNDLARAAGECFKHGTLRKSEDDFVCTKCGAKHLGAHVREWYASFEHAELMDDWDTIQARVTRERRAGK